jgi:hypothetical protein
MDLKLETHNSELETEHQTALSPISVIAAQPERYAETA